MYGYTQGTYGNFNPTYTTGTAAAAVAAAYSGTNAAAQAAQAAQVAQAAFGYPTNNLAATGLDSTAAAAAANYYSAYGYGTGGATNYPGMASANAGYGFGNIPDYTSFTASNKKGNNARTGSALTTLTSANKTTGYPYDASMFAAASNFANKTSTFPKKNPFSVGAGAGGGGGGGMGGPNKYPTGKRWGLGASSAQHREPHAFYCDTCKISCAGQLTYKEHLDGKSHKKKEALAKGDTTQALPKSKVSFRCDLCTVTCTGKDTYEAHIRGSKHQKTVALCKRLGKPIPADEPTIIAPKEMGGTVPPINKSPVAPVPASSISVVGKKAIPQMHFVQGSKLSTTQSQQELAAKKAAVAAAVGSAGEIGHTVQPVEEEKRKELEALIAAESSVKPVGEDYVESEKDAAGKHLTYLCKLCDCKFSDINAKDIHLKGRRHRMQYKQKVDPSLEVELKPSSVREKRLKQYELRKNGNRQMMGPPMGYAMGGMMPPPMPGPMPRFPIHPRLPPVFPASYEKYTESEDDRHIMAKHAVICPDEESMGAVEGVVQAVERALKGISDHYESLKDKDAEQSERLLKGAMRIGIISKGLVLKDEKRVELVTLLSEPPSRSFLSEVMELLPKHLEGGSGDHELEALPEEAAILFTAKGKLPQVKILFTSTVLRQGEGEGTVVKPVDMLPEAACLAALADLRHSKWFQVKCASLQSCQVTLRILRDIRGRVSSWEKLSPWMTELIVEKVISSVGVPIFVGDALRRFFEAIASGILYSSGPGIADPCEKDPVDVLSGLSSQDREDMTSSGQHALRLIAFGQMHKILGMEKLPPATPSIDRKRPLDGSTLANDAKKDKPDTETEAAETEEVETRLGIKMEQS